MWALREEKSKYAPGCNRTNVETQEVSALKWIFGCVWSARILLGGKGRKGIS